MSLTAARKAGWNAFGDGFDVNPYPPGTTQHTYWLEGWKKAQRHYRPIAFSDLVRWRQQRSCGHARSEE